MVKSARNQKGCSEVIGLQFKLVIATIINETLFLPVDLTDNKKLKTEGKMDRAGAEMKEKVDDAVDTVKEKTQAVTNKARDAFERKRNRR